jgi:hypothetical protein
MNLGKEVKIYLPEVSDSDSLYFHGQFTEDSKSYKFFITKYTENYVPERKSQLLGRLTRSKEQEKQQVAFQGLAPNFIQIFRNEFNEITRIDTKINGESYASTNFLLVQYNLERFYQLSKNFKNAIERPEAILENDFIFLAKLIETDYEKSFTSRSLNNFVSLFYSSFIFLCNMFSIVLKPFTILFNNTAVCKHFVDWKKKLSDGDSDGSILFNVLMGIAVFSLLSYIHVPGKYFMSLTEVSFCQ